MSMEKIQEEIANHIGVPQKVIKFENFINDILKEDLRKLQLKNDELIIHLSEFIKLKTSLQMIAQVTENGQGFKTQLDLGRNFLVEAKVDDPSKILINIGLGIFVEYSLKESLAFIDKQILFYTENIKKLKKDSAHTKAMIKLVLQGLHELQLKV